MVGRLHHLSKAEAQRRADELLERLDLTDTATQLVKTFSGGMRRRLDLAASLVAAPPVLFLDEPTTGLDPRSRNDLWEMLRELVRDGTTIILTTQYLEEADQLADDIVVLDHGRTVAHGTPDELKAQIGTDRIDVTVATARTSSQRSSRATEQFASNAPSLDHELLVATIPVPRRHPPDGGHACARRRRHRRRRPQPPRGHARRRLPHPHRSSTAPARRGSRMTATAEAPEAPIASPRRRTPRPHRGGSLATWWSDTLVFAGRNIEHIRQIPEKLLDVTLQPLMFVLLFAYVFGGAIAISGGNYREYIIGGILIQSLAFGLTGPATAISTDLTEGVIDRFRSLPGHADRVPRRATTSPSSRAWRCRSSCCSAPG